MDIKERERELLIRYNSLVDKLVYREFKELTDWALYRYIDYKKAASYMHHTEKYGLLEHCIEVAEVGLNMLLTLSEDKLKLINKDHIIVGGLLHDVGKTYIMEGEPDICNMTTQSHAMVGANKVYEKMMSLGLYTPEEINQITNAVLGHHHSFRDSYFRYATIESYLVCLGDNVSALLDGACNEMLKGSTEVGRDTDTCRNAGVTGKYEVYAQDNLVESYKR